MPAPNEKIKNRNRSLVLFWEALSLGLKDPRRALPYLKNFFSFRNLENPEEHLKFFRAHLASLATVNPEQAVGSSTHEHWLEGGKKQFDYLVKMGLRPEHKVLELGCGNLRLGWRLIEYLDTGNYLGLDISPEMIQAAYRTLEKYKLQTKQPYLYLIESLDLKFLPEKHFDLIHAFSVFTHNNAETIDLAFQNAKKLLKPDGILDFTYADSANKPFDVFKKDFFYPKEFFENLGTKYDFKNIKEIEEWDYWQPRIRMQS